MSSNQNDNNNSKTIGFLIPNLGHYYTRELWREIYMYADEMGCNLLIFSGQPLSPDSADYDHSNLIYTLPNSAMLDGVIFATPSLMSRVSIEEFKEFKSKFSDIPNISIGAKLDDTYNITISNEISSKKIMNHLICSHGFSDIAYISGPLKNEEAVARKKGYIDALNENGLTFDDSKVIESGFHSIFGERAANKLIDRLSKLPQAIACGDDEIAMGVCEALKKRGIDVPGDIAIVGFDNSYKGANSTPGLTTVN